MNTKQIRFTIVLIVLVTLVITLLVYYGMVMLSPSRAESVSSYTQWKERGLIVDRNGTLLAIQVKKNTVTMWKPEIDDVEETAALLAEVLSLDRAHLSELLRSRNRFAIIKRTISEEETEKIRNLSRAGALKGIHLVPDTIREYPNEELASQIVGYVGIDNTGLAGIEYVFDRELSQAQGAAPFGNQVTLTIDADLQRYSEFIARQTTARERASYTSVVIMEAGTGEILSLASYPGFNPNEFTRYDDDERRNRVINDVYEPGSVFKIFSIASLLQLGSISPSDIFDATDSYNSEEGFQIRDIRNYGRITPRKIIQYSSNVGAAHAADRAANSNFFYMLKRFGFGEKTGIQLNGESAGILAHPNRWSARSRPTIAIGQEIGVTALQIVSAATVFANDGVLLAPQIVRQVHNPEGEVLQSFQRNPVREVVSPEVAQEILSYMQSATEETGTASRLKIDGVNISAKTGTAEVYDADSGTYSDEDFISSTLSIFPSEAPRFIVYVAIHRPSAGRIYGGRIAAPVVRELVEFLLSYYSLLPDIKTLTIEDDVQSAPVLPGFTDVLPDFTGLPKRALLPLLNHDTISVEIIGSGWVRTQSPPPGTEIQDDTHVVLTLE